MTCADCSGTLRLPATAFRRQQGPPPRCGPPDQIYAHGSGRGDPAADAALGNIQSISDPLDRVPADPVMMPFGSTFIASLLSALSTARRAGDQDGPAIVIGVPPAWRAGEREGAADRRQGRLAFLASEACPFRISGQQMLVRRPITGCGALRARRSWDTAPDLGELVAPTQDYWCLAVCSNRNSNGHKLRTALATGPASQLIRAKPTCRPGEQLGPPVVQLVDLLDFLADRHEFGGAVGGRPSCVSREGHSQTMVQSTLVVRAWATPFICWPLVRRGLPADLRRARP